MLKQEEAEVSQALTQSSKASLMRETRSTIDRGATLVIGLTGLQDKKKKTVYLVTFILY